MYLCSHSHSHSYFCLLAPFLLFFSQAPALKKARKDAVHNLPCRNFTSEAGVTRECYICLDVYEEGDKLRRCVRVYTFALVCMCVCVCPNTHACVCVTCVSILCSYSVHAHTCVLVCLLIIHTHTHTHTLCTHCEYAHTNTHCE